MSIALAATTAIPSATVTPMISSMTLLPMIVSMGIAPAGQIWGRRGPSLCEVRHTRGSREEGSALRFDVRFAPDSGARKGTSPQAREVPNADIAEPTPSGDTQKFLALIHGPNVLVQAEQVERVVFLF
jgi:hypothetical protein